MDRDALLDRFDEAVGESGIRGHTWPWLRDEAGDVLAVDVFWPKARVALVLVDVPATTDWVAASATTGARGITLIGLPPAGVGDGDVRLLRMLLLGDAAASMSVLSDHGADLWGRAATAADGGWFVFGMNYVGAVDDEDEDGWDDDEDAFGDDDEHELFGEGDGEEPAPRVELGWRTRPMALSALGAVALIGRVFAQALTAPIGPTEMQLLVAVAVAEEATVPAGDDIGSLATRLGLHVSESRYLEKSLVRAGLVIAPPPYPDGDVIPPALTEAGRDLVERWLARVGPLFAGWPPDHLGVDDAIG
jgi:DNA-binding MarR family transcriptional regulator